MTVTSNAPVVEATLDTASPVPVTTPPAPYPVATGDAEVGSTLVDVVAPSTMSEGFSFDASYNGKVFKVVVPAGGVVKGQVLSVPAPASASETKTTTVSKPTRITGQFKDDLCGCCNVGCCHPSCCVPFWAPFCAMGQVMTRLKLTWCASPAADEHQAKQTITILVVLGVLYWILNQFYASSISAARYTSIPLSILVIYLIVVGTRTRKFIRDRDSIPDGCCGGCDDCCTVYWCTFCAISQMMRHTGNYENGNEDWCSPTGLRNSEV